MIKEQFQDDINKVYLGFKKAEEKIKKLELSHKNLIIPSVNELRYAGYHLLQASRLTTDNEIKEEISKANRHTKRAIYDAIEASLVYILQEIELFDKEYNKIPETSEIIPEYDTKIANVKNIVAKLEDIEASSREEKYEEIEEFYTQLRVINDTLNNSIQRISVLIDKNENTQKKESRKYFFMIILMIITAFFAYKAIP